MEPADIILAQNRQRNEQLNQAIDGLATGVQKDRLKEQLRADQEAKRRQQLIDAGIDPGSEEGRLRLAQHDFDQNEAEKAADPQWKRSIRSFIPEWLGGYKSVENPIEAEDKALRLKEEAIENTEAWLPESSLDTGFQIPETEREDYSRHKERVKAAREKFEGMKKKIAENPVNLERWEAADTMRVQQIGGTPVDQATISEKVGREQREQAQLNQTWQTLRTQGETYFDKLHGIDVAIGALEASKATATPAEKDNIERRVKSYEAHKKELKNSLGKINSELDASKAPASFIRFNYGGDEATPPAAETQEHAGSNYELDNLASEWIAKNVKNHKIRSENDVKQLINSHKDLTPELKKYLKDNPKQIIEHSATLTPKNSADDLQAYNNIKEANIKSIELDDEMRVLASKAQTKEAFVNATKNMPVFLTRMAKKLNTKDMGFVEDVILGAYEAIKGKSAAAPAPKLNLDKLEAAP